jgi:predicted MFS family arabinose efflux permease
VLVPGLTGLALLAVFVWHALRDDEPLIDLRLFKNRVFASASTTLVLVAIAVFGSFLLLPLYFQAVRGESALMSGLLLAPQGFGAMLMMPIAGQLTDRTGIGRIVPFGLALIIASVAVLTQVTDTTPYGWLMVDLFFFGVGMGATMMPVFSGAMQTLRRSAVAKASTSLNILQQVGASIGTAVLSVILATALTARLPHAGGSGGGGLGATQNLPPAVHDRIAPLMADAFGHTFWWAVGLLVVAWASSLLLPKNKPEPVDDPDDPEAVAAEEAPVAVMA